MDDHDVDLVGTEAQLVAGEAVCDTQRHHLIVLFILKLQQPRQIKPNHSHQLINLLIVLACHTQGLSDSLTDFLISDGECLLELSLDNVLGEEFGEGFGDLTLHEFAD